MYLLLISLLSVISGVINFNQTNGLKNGHINDFTIDKDGYIWIGTNSGTSRFDGQRFQHMENTASMVTKTLYDPEAHIIYLATGTGLEILDCRTCSISTVPEILNTVTSLHYGTSCIWVGNRYGQLYSIDKKTRAVTIHSPDLFQDLPNSFLSICEFGEYLAIGHIAEGFSLLNISTGKVTRFIHDPDDPNSLPGNKVYALFHDSASRLWLGTNKGLALFNPDNSTFSIFRYDSKDRGSIISDNVKYITELSDNKLWIGTDVGGISVLDLGQIRYGFTGKVRFVNIESTENEYGLSSKNIRSIGEDKYGNIWVAHYGNGLDCIPKKGGLFHSIPYKNTEHSNINKPISSLAFDDEGNLWMGTYNEVVVLKNKQIIRKYPLESHISRSNALVYTILHDGDFVFLGLYDHGLLRLNKKDGSITKLSIGSDVDVNHLWKDHDNSIWIGTKTGIVHLSQTPENKIIDIPKPMQGISSYGFTRDSEGRLWIGGYGVGMCILSEDYSTLHTIRETRGSNSIIHQIHLDREKNEVWIAAKGGMHKINVSGNPDTFKTYGMKDGMIDSYVRALCTDRNGNIWFSTDIGISMIETNTGKIRNYGIEHGVVKGNYIDGASAISPDDGSIWFGSQGGLCYFHPDIILTNNLTSEIDIHEFNGIPYNGDFIRLNHKNRLNIRFGMKDFVQNNRVEYAYRLNGTDNDWIEIGTRSEVELLNLPWGHNTLHVKAYPIGEEWRHTSEHSFEFYVYPPFLCRWYCIVLYIVLAILTLFSIIRSHNERFKEKAMLEIERDKQDFFTNITHELRTPLTLITGPLDDLAEDASIPTDIHSRIAIIRKSADQLLELVNRLLEMRRAESFNKKLSLSPTNPSSLIQEIGVQFKELNKNKEFEFIIDVPKSDIFYEVDKNIVRTILNNLLGNAVKNTDTGFIRLKLEYINMKSENSEMLISVTDTGCGIPHDQIEKIWGYMYQIENSRQLTGSGIGLPLVKSLAELHGGKVSVRSVPGKGSTFYISIPVQVSSTTNGCPSNDKSIASEKIMLIIEDNTDICEYISDNFRNDYTTLCACDGSEGLMLARKHIPDIIITDLMMPGMNGFELIRAVRNDITISHIPIIVLTAKDQADDRQEAYELGVDSFITKPFNTSLLRSRINNILDRRRREIKRLVTKSLNEGFPIKKESMENITRLDREFLNDFTKIVHENLSNASLDLTFMQEHFHMSHSTLYRKVKGLTGLSVNGYIRKIRLNMALKMLQEEGTNVSETAYSCGFNDISYFISCFKNEFGSTPSEKRR